MTAATVGSGPGLSRNAIVLLIAWIAAGVALALSQPGMPARIVSFVFVLLGWVLAVMAHEFGHAFAAYRAGDHTIRDKGYLTLDPLKYVDVGVSIVIPIIAVVLGGIGFPGGAVYLREDLMRTRGGRAMAAFAGPLGTLVVFLLLVAAAWGIALTPLRTPGAAMLRDALAFLAFLQATALVLNLLPVPGLDGYGVLRPFLPQALTGRLRRFEGLAILPLLLAIFLIPEAALLIFAPALALTDLGGLPRAVIQAGWDTFRFWS